MTQTDRDGIQRRTEFRHLRRRFWAGLGAVKHNSNARYLLGAFLLGMCLLWMLRKVLFPLDTLGTLARPLDGLLQLSLLALTVLGVTGILLSLGGPQGSLKTREALRKAGLTNHAGEVPILVAKAQGMDRPRLTVWIFDPCGIPLEEWEDKQNRLEAALNITIARMSWAMGRERICLYAVPAKGDLPERLLWQESYLSPASFVLVLGEGLAGPVTVDLTRVPHVLLGGSTGSGKSVLLKLLLMQALRKGAQVAIADFKGGVDFPDIWHRRCRMCFQEEDLLDLLTELVEELENRKKLFRRAECPNLDRYHQVTGVYLPRWIFACDEVAEVLDKTGLSKEEKELVSQIESKLATIARQGRAFGIHLILATQRPDANILPGQIKNNIDFRACGRADNVLSQIILDSADAADRVPKEIPGRFLLLDGTLFQAYWFDENEL